MITVICPVFNEASEISNVIEFFLRSRPDEKELIIIDGGSSDDTKAIVYGYVQKYSSIRLMDNPEKFVPFALNKAILTSSGDPVIRLDAHTLYADDYFEKILATFSRTNADIVGGPMRAAGTTSFQKAVAAATSSSFGIGDSTFHDEKQEGYVDTVYLGAWKRSVFNDIGLFDTEMLRNQDDEFHYRAREKGKRIYLNPEIRSWYTPRNSPATLFRQYYQYGLFKPLVLMKVKSGIRLRHIIPALFTLYLVLLLLFVKSVFFYFPFVLYVILSIIFALRKSANFNVILNMLLVFPIIHIAYGSGFIRGLITVWFGHKPSV